MNIVVLHGVLSRAPELRVLASGSTLLQFDVSTPTATGTATVPVVWFDPPGAPEFDLGVDVVVFGEVRRRFFRAGGATQSRTEVVATRVVRSSNRRGVSSLLSRAAELVSGA